MFSVINTSKKSFCGCPSTHTSIPPPKALKPMARSMRRKSIGSPSSNITTPGICLTETSFLIARSVYLNGPVIQLISPLALAILTSEEIPKSRQFPKKHEPPVSGCSILPADAGETFVLFKSVLIAFSGFQGSPKNVL